jgi:hypothetical protein
MSLETKRLGGSEREPLALEIQAALPSASVVLWHLERLRGVEVISKKSWVLTDDFEAYFLYKDRLFVLQTPFVMIWLSMLGQPVNESIFAELERHLQTFPIWTSLLFPLSLVKYLFKPHNPPSGVLYQHDPDALRER